MKTFDKLDKDQCKQGPTIGTNSHIPKPNIYMTHDISQCKSSNIHIGIGYIHSDGILRESTYDKSAPTGYFETKEDAVKAYFKFISLQGKNNAI